jgi:hypothetical protein
MSLPTDRDARNALPIWDGLMMYFPDVWAEVAKVSVLGNKQHNLGSKLFWNREVSTDHLNMAKAVWRACAELQLAIEAYRLSETSTKRQWRDSVWYPSGASSRVCLHCGWMHWYHKDGSLNCPSDEAGPNA